MTHPLDGGVVLVTGASSGIGRELARQLAPRAKAVALVARRKERLDALAAELEAAKPGLRALAVSCDLSDLEACDRMLAEVERELGPVDVLVNNAGFGDMSMFDRADWPKTKRMIDVDVTALVYLTHRALPGMVARGRGGILNVSSGFGLNLAPGFAGYVGAKHFVTAFTECLRMDLCGTGVVVTQVCPGPVDTEFDDNLGNFLGRQAPAFVTLSPARVARAAVRAFLCRRALVIPGFWMKGLVRLGAWSPRWLLRWVYGLAARAMRRRQLAA